MTAVSRHITMDYIKALLRLILELTVIMTLVILGLLFLQPQPISHGSEFVLPDHSKNAPIVPIVIEVKREETVQEEITRQAEAYGVNVVTALAIAKCESTFNPEASSKISSAKGIYQFTDPTWRWIKAEGHQFDRHENIKQFMIYYKKYPTWWAECLP